MNKEDDKLIKKYYEVTNKYFDMDSLPKEFMVRVSYMARDLSIEIAKAKLVRTKEYAEYVRDKAHLLKLTEELEEALVIIKDRLCQDRSVCGCCESVWKAINEIEENLTKHNNDFKKVCSLPNDDVCDGEAHYDQYLHYIGDCPNRKPIIKS